VLADPDQRARYDRSGTAFGQVPPNYGRAGRGPGAPFGAGGGGGRRVYVNTRPFAGTGFGGAGFGGVAGSDFGGVHLADVLGGFYSRGRGPDRGRVPGADSEAEIELGVEDAYAGGRRRITLSTASGPRSYEVDIPAGITDGERIRLAGPGSGGRGGDLYLVVRLAPHPRYRVDGRDITVDVPVTPWEAALGASIPVPTPAGTARVELPAGSSSGRRLRLRGRGMPNPRGAPGDLYADVKIVVPATLSPAERELFDRLAAESRFDPRAETATTSA
jgi:curved DNA-binding protein